MPNLAVILAVDEEVTAFVEIEKFAVVAPAETVTLEGTDAKLELLLRMTDIPTVGAAEPTVTVPVTIEAPVAELAPSVRLVKAGASTVKLPDSVLVPSLAFMDAVVLAATGVVDTVKVVELDPEGTVTDDGTFAAVPDEDSETNAPFEPAFFDKVTVPVAFVPPTTEVGDRLTLVTVWPNPRPATRTEAKQKT